MTRVLVTGGSGFIGTNLVERFIARGDMVLNLDTAAPKPILTLEHRKLVLQPSQKPTAPGGLSLLCGLARSRLGWLR